MTAARWGRTVALACLVVSTWFVTVAAPPSAALEGGIGIRLVDVPVSAVNDPRAHLYVVDHLAPGTTIRRRIELSNTTGREVAVLAYAAAATIEHGSFIGTEGHSANELSTWTTVTPRDVVMSAGSVATTLVTIAVPTDAAPGEHYGAVWAEVRSSAAEQGGVVEVTRVGIRLYISVGPGGAPAADFAITSLTAGRTSDGAPMVSATVRNTGGRALDMSGSLQLADGPGGLSAGPFPASLGVTLAIGATDDVLITLDARVPEGPWQATIVLRSGLIERTATARFVFPATTGNAPPVSVDSRSWWTAGHAMAIAAVALLAGAVVAALWLVVRRRRGGRGTA